MTYLRLIRSTPRIAHIVAAACLIVMTLLSSSTPVRAAQQDRLQEAIYRHNKAVLEGSAAKYGARYEAQDYEVKDKYKSALVDLNDDRIMDAIVLFDDPDSCGSGGCSLEIYRGTKTGFEFVSRSTITNEPIRVASEMVHGWRSLIVFAKRKGDVLMRFNGTGYPLNPSMQRNAMPAQVNAAQVVIGTPSAPTAEWRWSAACPSPRSMALTVRLDTALLFQSSFPICRLTHDTSSLDQELTFAFTAARSIIWKGYTSGSDKRTGRGRPFDVTISQAGDDSLGTWLAIAVTSLDTTFFNAAHLAWADSAATTGLAEGLTVTTTPTTPHSGR